MCVSFVLFFLYKRKGCLIECVGRSGDLGTVERGETSTRFHCIKKIFQIIVCVCDIIFE